MIDLATFHFFIGCMMALAAPAFVATLIVLVDGMWPDRFSFAFAQGTTPEPGPGYLTVAGMICIVKRSSGFEVFFSLAVVTRLLRDLWRYIYG